MYLANNPKKITTLQKGDRCIFRSSDGSVSFTRNGIALLRSMSDGDVFLIYLDHMVSKGELVLLIAETNGLAFKIVENRGDETVYEFM